MRTHPTSSRFRVISYLIAVIVLYLFGKCANQSSPTGGPQDKEPPKLLSTDPQSNQRNFGGEKIELTFDEFIKLKDPAEEIIITPSVGKDTKYLVKKKKLVIVPKAKLLENTTYNISFRDAVQDLNEGNPIFNLRLAFSTGDEIDSLNISGSVYQLFKEEIAEKITVALYQSDTFNIFNHKPIYFTRTDKKGNFLITNLKPGKYFVYAFDDKSKNLKVESKSERFGYLVEPIVLPDTNKIIKKVNIPLLRVDARPIKITSVRNTQKTSKVRFSKLIDSVKVESEYKDYFINTFGDKRDELVFYGVLEEQPEEDSIKINLHVTDSVGNRLDTIAYLKSNRVRVPKEQFKIEFSTPAFDMETAKVTTRANFNKPIKGINLDSLYIQIDSTTFQNIKEKEITIDTLNHSLTITTQLELKKAEKTEQLPTPILVIGRAAFISLEQDSSKARTDKVRIRKEEDLGSLAIEVKTKEKNYIIELLTSGGETIRKEKNITKSVFKFLEPQEYKIRVTVDTNNNERWDPGNFEKKIKPEEVIIYKSIEGKTSIPIRANWEVGPILLRF